MKKSNALPGAEQTTKAAFYRAAQSRGYLYYASQPSLAI
jgi:hypothetical protein